jgi:DNA-binding transcriptional LysR family regulator
MCRIIGVNLTDIDLNLLLVLHTVLTEGGATRAAARLHVTQSAVSNSLARLRRLLGDKLVVRSAGRLVPTPRASALRPLLAGGLERFQAAIAGAESSGLAHTSRRFTLACTDFVALVLVPRLMAAFSKRLPRAALRVVSVDYAIAGNGLATGEVDLLVGLPPVLPPGCFSEPAFTDHMVCIVRRDHPTVRGRLTIDSFTRLGHVEVALFGLSTGVDEALARINRTRNVALSISHLVSCRSSCCRRIWSRRSPAASLERSPPAIRCGSSPHPCRCPRRPFGRSGTCAALTIPERRCFGAW